MNNPNPNSLPSFFLDSQNIKNLRKIAQRPKDGDEAICFHVLRPLTIYVSSFLVKHTNVTANTITLIMALLAFFTPLLFYFISDKMMLVMAAPILFYGTYFLDAVDGEIARLRNVFSRQGYWMDISLWVFLPLIFISFIWKVVQLFEFSDFLIIAAILLVSLKLYIIVSLQVMDELKSKKSDIVLVKTNYITLILYLYNVYLWFLVTYSLCLLNILPWNILEYFLYVYIGIHFAASLKNMKYIYYRLVS